MVNLKSYLYSKNGRITYNINERLHQSVKILNLFLENLREKEPGICDRYQHALKTKLISLISTPKSLNTTLIPNLQDIIQECNELQKLYLTYTYQLLEIPLNYSSKTIVSYWSHSDRSV
ncbi:MAG: hypothetical protein ACXAD7_15530, partial [Candidatus Kariarchaeaceae archaeon]